MVKEARGSAAEAAFDRMTDRTVNIVAAYVSNNILPAKEVPALIAGVHATLNGLDLNAEFSIDVPRFEVPNQDQVKRSITPAALISFVDGRPYKMLRRHLRMHNMTPQSYRARYGLPQDYPMTAPEYSARRTAIAQMKKPRPPRAG